MIDDNPVIKEKYCMRKPAHFGGGYRRFQIGKAEEVPLGQVTQVSESPRSEVGDFKKISQHIVGIVTQ
jgi:hypothetical protein